MADAIGSLGLDTKGFDEASIRISNTLLSMTRQAEGADVAFLGLAAGIALFAKQISDAAKAADEFDAKVKSIANDSGGSATKSISELNSRIKETKESIASLGQEKGPLASIVELLRQGFEDFGAENPSETAGAKKAQELKSLMDSLVRDETSLAEKTKATNEILQMQIDGNKEGAELKKIELKYAELIAAVEKTTNTALVEQLKTERDKTIELSKQNALYRDPARRAASGIAEDQAKSAIGALLGDQQNDATIKDRDAQRKQDEMDFFHDQERQSGERALEEKAARDKIIRDLAIANRQSASDAATQTAIGAATQSGRKPFANELSVRQSFLQRKRDAIANHNDAELAEIEKQEQQALRDAYAAEGAQTPGQARADRREEHHRDIEASKQERREDELRKRAANGEDSRAIQDQLEKDRQRAKFGAETDIAKKEANQVRGFTQGDSTNLSTIAKAYEAGLK